MILLCQSQIFRKKARLQIGVVRETGEVEVCKWAAREQVPSQHLADGLYVVGESSDTGLSPEEKGEEEGKAQREEVAPSGQCGLKTVSGNPIVWGEAY